MRQIWIIAKRELRSYFDSLMAYIMIVAFLGFTGFFTWFYGTDIFFQNQASMSSFFNIAYWTLFFFIPALTMRQIAEERKTGTIELLLTKAVTDWQVVVGKFLATLLLISITLFLTLPYYISISLLGPIDHSAVWCGYLGLILMSASYVSIGIFASSVTSNQIIAFLMALFIGIFFHILFQYLGSAVPGTLGSVFLYLNLSSHYESIVRGVVDSKDIIYFMSIIILGLFLAELVLVRRDLK